MKKQTFYLIDNPSKTVLLFFTITWPLVAVSPTASLLDGSQRSFRLEFLTRSLNLLKQK